jgi:hypothetical protein
MTAGGRMAHSFRGGGALSSAAHRFIPSVASVEQGLVIIAPELALQLVKALQENLEADEAAHGKIREIKPPKPPAEKKFLE